MTANFVPFHCVSFAFVCSFILYNGGLEPSIDIPNKIAAFVLAFSTKFFGRFSEKSRLPLSFYLPREPESRRLA